ncbi:MAG: hypothetical protein HN704_18310 [Bacteroidetes bacterium]|jgi:hypothetical protein|nr:hypothetical protein [Bacteroidota bacterium]MBT7493557.1 hypothetical protein [Bacteroidota bacterium]
MKKLIIFLFIAASFSAISQTDSIGYVVYVKGIYDTKRHKITTIEKVTEKLNIHFPDVKVDIEKELTQSDYFQMMNEYKIFLVEKKRIVVRNGKTKYKRL